VLSFKFYKQKSVISLARLIISWSGSPNNILRGAQVIKLLIMQFSPVFCHFLPLRPESDPGNPGALRQCPALIWQTNFVSNNQPDALIMQILFCYKTLHVSKHSQDVPSWLCLEAAIKTCMKLTSAEYTVENSWWWAEKMPETCRVELQFHPDCDWKRPSKPTWNLPVPNIQ